MHLPKIRQHVVRNFSTKIRLFRMRFLLGTTYLKTLRMLLKLQHMFLP